MKKAIILIVITFLAGIVYPADLLLDTAEDISTDTSNFNDLLDGTCTDVQAALEKIDDNAMKNSGDTGNGNYTITGTVTIGDNTMTNPTIIFDGQTDNPPIYYDNTLDMIVINADVMIGTP